MVGELPLFQAVASNFAPTTEQHAYSVALDDPLADDLLHPSRTLHPLTMPPSEKQMRILHFVAQLRQSFSAALTATRRSMDEYRRVAAESSITVQVKETTLEILDKLVNSVRMRLDVL